jgi:tetratricopeptide (TPR) repeat protein
MPTNQSGPSRSACASSEEPGAVVPHAGICGGATGNRRHYLNGNMKKKILLIVLACFTVISLIVAGGGILAYSQGYYHSLLGGHAENDKNIDKAIYYYKISYEKNPEAFMVAHSLACCYAKKGDNNSCFYWLRIALKTHHADYARNYSKTEHDLDSVRQTPEFQSLIYGANN